MNLEYQTIFNEDLLNYDLILVDLHNIDKFDEMGIIENIQNFRMCPVLCFASKGDSNLELSDNFTCLKNP